MPLTRAQQAEIIRSNQKDGYYQGYIRGVLSDAAQTFLGARTWIKWRKELEVLADLGYFGLTTLAGFQTLGEEYVNVVQVDNTRRAVPSSWRRLVMILLHTMSPYLIDRALIWLQKELRGNPQLHVTAEGRERLLEGISLLRHVITVVHRCHLAVFYLRGVFYHIAKRVAGVQYLVVRGNSNPPQHWGYRVLGWLALMQLTFTFIQALYKVKAKDKTKPQQLDHISQSSHLSKSSRPVNQSAGNTCALCLEIRKNSTATPCGHLFCWTCITEWCSSKPECPLCRDKFQMSRLIFLQNYDAT